MDPTKMIAYTHSNGWNTAIPIIATLLSLSPLFLDSIRQDWLRLERRILKMYPVGRFKHKVCPFVPRTLLDYIYHVVEMKEGEQETIKKRKRRPKDRSYMCSDTKHKKYLPFWGREFGHLELEGCLTPFTPHWNRHENHPFRSPVLGEITIWHRWIVDPRQFGEYRAEVNWPSPQEMSWEGDERVATENGRYGRFPPMPRRDDYSTPMPFPDKDQVKAWDFDETWHVPSGEDIYLEIDEIDEDIGRFFLDKDLQDDIDESSIPVPLPSKKAAGKALG